MADKWTKEECLRQKEEYMNKGTLLGNRGNKSSHIIFEGYDQRVMPGNSSPITGGGYIGLLIGSRDVCKWKMSISLCSVGNQVRICTPSRC